MSWFYIIEKPFMKRVNIIIMMILLQIADWADDWSSEKRERGAAYHQGQLSGAGAHSSWAEWAHAEASRWFGGEGSSRAKDCVVQRFNWKTQASVRQVAEAVSKAQVWNNRADQDHRDTHQCQHSALLDALIREKNFCTWQWFPKHRNQALHCAWGGKEADIQKQPRIRQASLHPVPSKGWVYAQCHVKMVVSGLADGWWRTSQVL